MSFFTVSFFQFFLVLKKLMMSVQSLFRSSSSSSSSSSRNLRRSTKSRILSISKQYHHRLHDRGFCSSRSTIDYKETSKFDQYGDSWWSRSGAAGPLHEMNPCRIRFIENSLQSNMTAIPFKGLRFADIGSGGGILSESLARLGATVVGIDPCENNVRVATEHASLDSRIKDRIEYRVGTAEDFVSSEEGQFDVVCALEVVEHVSDLELFVESCSKLTKSNGDMFFSTVNRTPLSYALGIVAAEYVLRMVPPGTHDWNRFVTPNELEAALLRSNATVEATCGMVLNPLSGRWILNSTQHEVNYITHASRY